MATYRSDVAKSSFQPATRPQHAIIGYPFSLTVSAALATDDVLILGKIPKDCTLLAFLIDIPDLDTDASPTLRAEIGDSGDSDRFVANTLAAAPPGNGRALVSSMTQTDSDVGNVIGVIASILPRRYTSLSDLRITITAGATALSAAVTIKGWYTYTTYPKYRDPGQ